MTAESTSIEQQAKIIQINGNVQLIRDGLFLPAQSGMILLAGDRVVSDLTSKAVIQFTGVKESLIIENGAAATFNLEVVAMDQIPQWIATDLYGEGVYFDGQQATENAASTASTPDLFGLFGTPGAKGETTGYPVLESLVFLGATAAIYSDNEDNESNTTETSNTGESGNNNPPPPEPEPEPEPEPPQEPGSSNDALAPVTDALEDLFSTLGAPSPLGSLAALLPTTDSVPGLPST